MENVTQKIQSKSYHNFSEATNELTIYATLHKKVGRRMIMTNEQDTMLLDSEEANEVKQNLQESNHMNLTINDSQERVRPWIVQGE